MRTPGQHWDGCHSLPMPSGTEPCRGSSQQPRPSLILQTRTAHGPRTAAGYQRMPRGLAEPVQSFLLGNPSFQQPCVFGSPSKTNVEVLDTQKGGGGAEEKTLLPALRWVMLRHPDSWLKPPEKPQDLKQVTPTHRGGDRDRMWDPLSHPRALAAAVMPHYVNKSYEFLCSALLGICRGLQSSQEEDGCGFCPLCPWLCSHWQLNLTQPWFPDLIVEIVREIKLTSQALGP